MSQSQIERWANHHNCPRTGKIFEIPFFTYILPRVGVALAFAGVISYFNPILFWNYKPPDLEPEFRAEVAKIGNVAQRMNGPPVYLNPFRHRIPGNISGPEDVAKEFGPQ
ncbi:MAG: hypothetical protein WDW36_009241 [Sanguina aurantia]